MTLSPEQLAERRARARLMAREIIADLRTLEVSADTYPELATLAYLISLARQEAEKDVAALAERPRL